MPMPCPLPGLVAAVCSPLSSPGVCLFLESLFCNLGGPILAGRASVPQGNPSLTLLVSLLSLSLLSSLPHLYAPPNPLLQRQPGLPRDLGGAGCISQAHQCGRKHTQGARGFRGAGSGHCSQVGLLLIGPGDTTGWVSLDPAAEVQDTRPSDIQKILISCKVLSWGDPMVRVSPPVIG